MAARRSGDVKSSYSATRTAPLATPQVAARPKATLDPAERRIKRLFDVLVGGVLTVMVWPVGACIAAAIALDTPGPVIFKQQRVGENGRRFWMFKFRTMVKDAQDHERAQAEIGKQGLVLFKRRDDPRVTRVGRWLRRTSLDELPQLLNVIRGDMSLVGPRPELPWIVEQFYEPWQFKRQKVPQGMTGWWQIHGRSDRPMHLHTQDDLYYIQNYSFWLDLEILWRTIGAVINGRGAY